MRTSPAAATYICVNCNDPLNGPGAVKRGQDTAWHGSCYLCYELTADQLELIEDRPGGTPIQLYRCRRCGAARSCRPGWRTRCHVCLDERSTGVIATEAGQDFLARLEDEPSLAQQARQVLGLGPDEAITLRAAAEASAYLALADELRQLERPGWSLLAADVCGLPWAGTRTRHYSHGTWARHDACGTIAKLGTGTVDCPACGPEQGSRTHLSRADEPYLMYLVCTKRWQKFGVGDQRRVREHMRGSASVVQVLRAPFAEVVLAEKTLKQRHRDATPQRVRRGMIASFGQGTEVTRRRVPIDLSDVLPNGEDVTSWFRPGG
jgi:hypothetical protein